MQPRESVTVNYVYVSYTAYNNFIMFSLKLGTVIRLQPERPRNRDSIPAENKFFYSP
jgi:hypothetical protein